MSKKTDKPVASGSEVATSETFGRPNLPEWFERWPDFLGRRWPEGFGNFPLFGEGCRLEQFTDDDGTLVLRAELPGLGDDDDVDVSVDDGRLTISGKREQRSEHREKGSFNSEFRYGSFERTVRLPAGARADEIMATYDDGILEVRVPVDTDAKSITTVPIKNRA